MVLFTFSLFCFCFSPFSFFSVFDSVYTFFDLAFSSLPACFDFALPAFFVAVTFACES